MSRISARVILMTAIVGLALTVASPVLAQGSGACGPLDNGRVANVFYKGDAIFFEPIVRYEYTRAVLTISGPCENIVRTFQPGEQIFFDLGQVKRTLDGKYTWQLRFTPAIDPAVQDALQEARGTGQEEDVWWSFWQKGAIPADASVDSASFSVVQGLIIDPASGEESQKSATLAPRSTGRRLGGAAIAAAPAAARGGTGLEGTAGSGSDAATLAPKDFVIIDDLIVDGSACIGFDCVNGESFGFDTVRLKENNLRIKFDDTSTAASFPRNDWQLTANDSANGGLSKFSIDDITGSRTPFTIEAGAPSHSLYVDDGGRIGFGTSTPSVELHTVDGDTPTLRLQQDGSSGFAPQTWDVAGNETNFFVRDVTNGSKLPLRIRPGAPTSSIDIAADGDIGIGTSSPANRFHIENTSGDDADDFLVTSDGQLTIGSTSAGSLPTLMKLTNPSAGTGGGAVRFVLENSSGNQWSFTNDNAGGGEMEINYIPNAGVELLIDGSGNVTATSFNPTSSRTLKNDVEPVEPKEVLARLSALPINTWKFLWEEDGTRHLGPMAEEFKQAFGLGQSERTINLTDAAGVAFAAIQGLQQEVEEKNSEVASLRQRNDELAERLEKLEALVQALSEQ